MILAECDAKGQKGRRNNLNVKQTFSLLIVFKMYVSHRKLVRQEPSQHVHLIMHTCSCFFTAIIDEVFLKPPTHVNTLNNRHVQNFMAFANCNQTEGRGSIILAYALVMLKTIRGDWGCIPLSLA